MVEEKMMMRLQNYQQQKKRKKIRNPQIRQTKHRPYIYTSFIIYCDIIMPLSYIRKKMIPMLQIIFRRNHTRYSLMQYLHTAVWWQRIYWSKFTITRLITFHMRSHLCDCTASTTTRCQTITPTTTINTIPRSNFKT